jgi:hypothetical protein
MPKPAELDIDLNAPAHMPPAATAPRTVKASRKEPSPQSPKNDTPVNFRWPAAEVKAMKRAALEADMTMQDFLLSCFHAFLQRKK